MRPQHHALALAPGFFSSGQSPEQKRTQDALDALRAKKKATNKRAKKSRRRNRK